MREIFYLTKRNCLVYLRDKSAVFFSLLSMLIVLGLMVVFLGKMNSENVLSVIEEYGGKKEITGQSIGQASYTATVQECDEAQADLNKLLDKQKNQQEV